MTRNISKYRNGMWFMQRGGLCLWLPACLPACHWSERAVRRRQLAKERGFRSLAYGTELNECMASCALEDRIGEPRQVFVPKVLTGWRPSAGNKRTKWYYRQGSGVPVRDGSPERNTS